MTTQRDLDGWADALGVSNDDEAVAVLGRLLGHAGSVSNILRMTVDALRGVDERGLAARAADRIDTTADALHDAARGFLGHERGGR